MRIISVHDKLNILLIEDSKGDSLLIEKALKSALPDAYTLTRAPTLSAAVKELTEKEFDIALLDRSLPDVEGFSGLRSIQVMAPELPVVFLTAYKDEHMAFEAIEQGAQDYLFKDGIDVHIIKRALQYAILRKQFESVLILRANFDLLTGLANRMLFESRLEMGLARMHRTGGNLAVLFLDLNRFKQVNDDHGHAAGDALLKQVAGHLRKAMRPYDTIARFGGDEFAILVEAMPEPQHCDVVAEKIIQLLDAPVDIAGHYVSVGVSIGITRCVSGQKLSAEALMKQADAAMYAAKSQAQSAYRYYDEQKVSAA